MDDQGLYFFMGCMAAFLVGFVIIWAKRGKRCAARGDLDERQRLIQGNAFRYGFFTLALVECIYALADSTFELPIESWVGNIGCVMFGCLVNVIYCIWKDAYFGLHANRKQILLLMIILGISNTMQTMCKLTDGVLWENGQIGINGIFPMSAMFFWFAAAAVIAKMVADKKAQ